MAPGDPVVEPLQTKLLFVDYLFLRPVASNTRILPVAVQTPAFADAQSNLRRYTLLHLRDHHRDSMIESTSVRVASAVVPGRRHRVAPIRHLTVRTCCRFHKQRALSARLSDPWLLHKRKIGPYALVLSVKSRLSSPTRSAGLQSYTEALSVEREIYRYGNSLALLEFNGRRLNRHGRRCGRSGA
jgi:hypothetical protein